MKYQLFTFACCTTLCLFTAAVHAEVTGSPRPVVQQNFTRLINENGCPGCDLAGVVLTRVDLSGANLQGANLAGAKLYLTDLSGADLRNANLQGAALGGADLADADLTGANLTGAVLEGAYLKGARMDGRVTSSTPEMDDDTPAAEEKVFVAEESRPKPTPYSQEVVIEKRRDLNAAEVKPSAEVKAPAEAPHDREPVAENREGENNQQAGVSAPKQPLLMADAVIPAEPSPAPPVFSPEEPPSPVAESKEPEPPVLEGHSKLEPPEEETQSAPKVVERTASRPVPVPTTTQKPRDSEVVPEPESAAPASKAVHSPRADVPEQRADKEEYGGVPSAEVTDQEAPERQVEYRHDGESAVVEEVSFPEPKQAHEPETLDTEQSISMEDFPPEDDAGIAEDEQIAQMEEEEILEVEPKDSVATGEVSGEPVKGSLTADSAEPEARTLPAASGPEYTVETPEQAAARQQVLIEKLLDEDRCVECDLAGVDLSGRRLTEVDLERADLSGADLSEANLSEANLKGVNLRGANLRGADLSEADLYRADLTGADLTGADLEETLLDSADLTDVIGLPETLPAEEQAQ